MSPLGRPKGEYRSTKRKGTPMSIAGPSKTAHPHAASAGGAAAPAASVGTFL
jgi:hypothetical protein